MLSIVRVASHDWTKSNLIKKITVQKKKKKEKDKL